MKFIDFVFKALNLELSIDRRRPMRFAERQVQALQEICDMAHCGSINDVQRHHIVGTA
jgi:hypothetical protein